MEETDNVIHEIEAIQQLQQILNTALTFSWLDALIITKHIVNTEKHPEFLGLILNWIISGPAWSFLNRQMLF